MVLGLDAALALEAGSAIGLAAIGVALFFVRTRRVYTMVFALFLLVWGAMLGSAAAVRGLADAGAVGAARVSLLVHIALVVDAYVPLAYFAAVYPVRHGPSRSWLGVGALLAPAVAGNAALVWAPTLFHAGVAPGGTLGIAGRGILYHAYQTLFLLGFLYAILSLYRYQDRTRLDLEKRRALYVLSSFLLLIGFTATEALTGQRVPVVEGGLAGLGFATIVLASRSVLAIAVVGAVAVAVAIDEDAGRPIDRGLVVAAAAVAALAGATSGVWGAALGVDPLAAWRLATVAGIAYAIIRFETFDAEVKVVRGAVGATVFGVAALGAFGTYQVLEQMLGSTALAAGLAQALLAALLAVAVVAGDEGLVGGLVGRIAAPRKLEDRRFEVYEAALARAMASGRLDADRTFLADLRRRLGISRAGHELVVRLVEEAPPEPEQVPEVGDVLADRYRVESAIGEGASGEVLRARDLEEDRTVVVKLLKLPTGDRTSAIRDFVREAHLASRVEDPHVVQILDMGVAGDRPFLVMEHVAGGTLEDRLDQAGRLEVREAARIADQVLAGLEAIHDKGVVHRDLKPSNVLLGEDGRAWIADFGVATRVDPSSTASGLGEVADVAGTPSTMSPEVARGEPATPRSDLFAVGAVLHEMLAGEPYVDLQGSAARMMRTIRRAEPAPLPDDVPVDVARVVRRALSKDPEDRFASAAAMREALREAVRGVSPSGTSAGTDRPR